MCEHSPPPLLPFTPIFPNSVERSVLLICAPFQQCPSALPWDSPYTAARIQLTAGGQGEKQSPDPDGLI